MQKKSKYILAVSIIFAATAMLLFTFAIPEPPIEARSDDARTPAIYGYNSAPANSTAIIGRAENGVGIKGIGRLAVIGEGQMVGVEGKSTDKGVKGIGQNGVYGESSFGTGIGVWGYSKKPAGPAIGVLGTTDSLSGKGVQGDGFYAVYGKCTNPNGYAGYFDGGKGLRIPVLARDPVIPEDGTIWVNRANTNQPVMKIRMGGRNYILRADTQ